MFTVKAVLVRALKRPAHDVEGLGFRYPSGLQASSYIVQYLTPQTKSPRKTINPKTGNPSYLLVIVIVRRAPP